MLQVGAEGGEAAEADLDPDLAQLGDDDEARDAGREVGAVLGDVEGGELDALRGEHADLRGVGQALVRRGAQRPASIRVKTLSRLTPTSALAIRGTTANVRNWSSEVTCWRRSQMSFSWSLRDSGSGSRSGRRRGADDLGEVGVGGGADEQLELLRAGLAGGPAQGAGRGLLAERRSGYAGRHVESQGRPRASLATPEGTAHSLIDPLGAV